jgi:hypothetical protein
VITEVRLYAVTVDEACDEAASAAGSGDR